MNTFFFKDFLFQRINISFAISAFVHFLVIFIVSYNQAHKKPDFSNYQLVQLINMTAVSTPKNAVRKVSQDIKLSKISDGVVPADPTPAKPENENESEGAMGDYSSYLPFFKVLKLPEFKTMIKPVYPPTAKLKNSEAEVVVEVYIDAAGMPRKVVVLQSAGEEFDNAVVEAVTKSTFSPAISKDGKPVPVRVRIPFNFELE